MNLKNQLQSGMIHFSYADNSFLFLICTWNKHSIRWNLAFSKYIFIICILIYIVLLNKNRWKLTFVKIKTQDNKKSISQMFLTTQEEKQLVQ